MRTSGIRPEDIILIDKNGRKIYGIVRLMPHRGDVVFEALNPRETYTRAKPREIIGHWRKTVGPRPSKPTETGAAGRRRRPLAERAARTSDAPVGN